MNTAGLTAAVFTAPAGPGPLTDTALRAERRVNPFRPHPPRCRRCSQALDTCPCNDDGGVS